MGDILSLNSWVWNDTGVTPAPGDEIYTPGDQPVAGYDNAAMWSVTRDIYNLEDMLAGHEHTHEAGGIQELDLQNLKVNNVLALNADPSADRYRWVRKSDGQSIMQVDVVAEQITQFPEFGVAPRLERGAIAGDDVVRDDAASTILFDYDAGADGKFHHAKYADDAGSADTAGVADDIAGYDLSTFLTDDQDATITGTWTHQNTLGADISGTANHAKTATQATRADQAETAGYSDNSDKVDGYEAEELIDEASAQADWAHIDTAEFTDDTSLWEWEATSTTTYDMYKFEVQYENHTDRHGWARLWIQNDERGRYYKTNLNRWHHDAWHWLWNRDRYSSNMTNHPKLGSLLRQHWMPTCDTAPRDFGFHEFKVVCPKAETTVSNPGKKYPKYVSTENYTNYDTHSYGFFGELRTDYSSIDTFRMQSARNATGRVKFYGRNI